jgi:uncharacterized metal-binding protein YceD (DUF177 family)
MFIDINTLGPEGLAFDRVLHLRGLEGPSHESLDDVEAHLSGSVVPSAGEADLTARVEATMNLQCGRCLEPFPWTARSEFDLRVVRAPKENPETEIVAPEGKLELEGMVAEQLYLGYPLKPVCRPDCQGLCPDCGANRNTNPCDHAGEPVDPRLAPLLRFRQRKSRES